MDSKSKCQYLIIELKSYKDKDIEFKGLIEECLGKQFIKLVNAMSDEGIKKFAQFENEVINNFNYPY